ncbi:hypothetical protein O181_041464 [Austropuccinia psidii MF-1]|uniref:Uncharacterized protein n=1 Tax=Austropuccinia psidii MF-1 TaxID=1389203 RepID=A0A9Q3DEG5_9BASI|nr:hypothetical protein [Austropuccinia psidii MF-1]
MPQYEVSGIKTNNQGPWEPLGPCGLIPMRTKGAICHSLWPTNPCVSKSDINLLVAPKPPWNPQSNVVGPDSHQRTPNHKFGQIDFPNVLDSIIDGYQKVPHMMLYIIMHHFHQKFNG